MIAVDTNILVYAHRVDAPFHEAAERCVRGLAEGTAPWAVPWQCIVECFGIVTHPRIYAPPSPLDVALRQIDAWLASPSIVLLAESAAAWPGLRRLLHDGLVAGPRVHDARIAALCIEHGVTELYSADRDFGRFPALRTTNPLSG